MQCVHLNDLFRFAVSLFFKSSLNFRSKSICSYSLSTAHKHALFPWAARFSLPYKNAQTLLILWMLYMHTLSSHRHFFFFLFNIIRLSLTSPSTVAVEVEKSRQIKVKFGPYSICLVAVANCCCCCMKIFHLQISSFRLMLRVDMCVASCYHNFFSVPIHKHT